MVAKRWQSVDGERRAWVALKALVGVVNLVEGEAGNLRAEGLHLTCVNKELLGAMEEVFYVVLGKVRRVATHLAINYKIGGERIVHPCAFWMFALAEIEALGDTGDGVADAGALSHKITTAA